MRTSFKRTAWHVDGLKLIIVCSRSNTSKKQLLGMNKKTRQEQMVDSILTCLLLDMNQDFYKSYPFLILEKSGVNVAFEPHRTVINFHGQAWQQKKTFYRIKNLISELSLLNIEFYLQRIDVASEYSIEGDSNEE